MNCQEFDGKNSALEPEHVVQLQGVSVAFQTPHGIRTVLHELDLDVHKGEWITIVGKNGSGKSTLAQVIMGLLPVSKGTVRKPQHPGSIQMVFQNPETQIIGETIYEDLCFGMENLAFPPSVMKEKAETVLRQVGLFLPLEHPTAELSGGQKQLLGIASCLAVDAEVLVFDEATSMLDPGHRAQVLAVVRRLHQEGQTIIWITQWMEEVVYADRVIALDTGSCVFEGSPRQFFYGDNCRFNQVGTTPCQQLQFQPPYVVQVALCLRERGVELEPPPLEPWELGRVVKALCQ
jgi:energy-coupling factor transport system ATP-binding protein